MKYLSIFLFIMLSLHSSYAQKMDTVFLKNLLESSSDLFPKVLKEPNTYDIQILYTQIDRTKNNHPLFKSFAYHLNSKWYFYPASTVKLPASIFALEKINTLNITGLNKETPLKIDSAFEKQTCVTVDSTAANGFPSIAHYIKKILLVSDNDAFNRLYEFIGRAELNSKLKAHGLSGSRIVNRLAIGDGGEAAKHTNPMSFYLNDKTIYSQAPQYDELTYPLELQNLKQGRGYMNNKNELINEPFDFSNKNVFPLDDQQFLMKKLFFPEYFPKEQRLNLKPEDYQFLYQYMSMYPAESQFPKYNPNEKWATYAKFLYYGSEKEIVPDNNIRIFNKVGNAYGYLIDNIYFVDFKNGVEFLLSAVINVNEDGIYNDDKYAYDSVGFPFMKNLGRIIYHHELHRPKKYLPDLSKFKIHEKP